MILNKSRKTTLSREHKLCKSKFSKARGLMFRLNPKALVFVFEKEKIVALHMLFVFFPIDVLYLDKKKKVVEIKEKLMPFSFYTPKKKSSYVMELPAGTISRTGTETGDKISF
jgi:uncharacterized membrane protein (UPF0127 family)